MNIVIVNKRKGERGDFYCGRGSPLGNPSVTGTHGTRDECCDQYEAMHFPKMLKDEQALGMLRRIYRFGKAHGIVRLECYCAPLRCHCETIKRFIQSHDT